VHGGSRLGLEMIRQTRLDQVGSAWFLSARGETMRQEGLLGYVFDNIV
jgi:hypothetical protein